MYIRGFFLLRPHACFLAAGLRLGALDFASVEGIGMAI